jgi:hypothetical protein
VSYSQTFKVLAVLRINTATTLQSCHDIWNGVEVGEVWSMFFSIVPYLGRGEKVAEEQGSRESGEQGSIRPHGRSSKSFTNLS